MKCNDFYYIYNELHQMELEELKAAVIAHGGEYTFFELSEDGDYDEEECHNNSVWVMGSQWWSETYNDYLIQQITVDKSGAMTIYGITKDYSDEAVEIDTIAKGHVGYITEVIRPTDSVEDITRYKVNLSVKDLKG